MLIRDFPLTPYARDELVRFLLFLAPSPRQLLQEGLCSSWGQLLHGPGFCSSLYKGHKCSPEQCLFDRGAPATGDLFILLLANNTFLQFWLCGPK